MSSTPTQTELQQWAGVHGDHPRVSLAVVFTDIIDSTDLAVSVGDAVMFDLLVKHFDSAREIAHELGGFEIKLIGDAFMVAFRTVDAALNFARRFMANTGDPRITIRVGIDRGEVRIKDDDIYGLMVNYASRLSGVPVRGKDGIFVSTSVKRGIESEYGADQKDIRFELVSAATLKGFSEKEEVWQVLTPEVGAARTARMKAYTEKQKRMNRNSPRPTPTVPTEPSAQSEIRLPTVQAPLRTRLESLLNAMPETKKEEGNLDPLKGLLRPRPDKK